MSKLEQAREELLEGLKDRIRDPRVLEAMADVPRELFVPPELVELAYDDAPLPIGEGQTISQPLIVALMVQALELQGVERVLEVGTGSGYQAAILGRLAAEVITVERFPQLAQHATEVLRQLGATNVRVALAGNVLGWPAGAPYDGIVVAAAAPAVPQALLDQLADGGRLVIPVGSRTEQDLLVVTHAGDRITRRSLGPCRFVPLIGVQAWPEDRHGNSGA